MDWSPDYCLSCDRQISQSGHGAYCSQSCRLADLERACNSGSSSPQTAPTVSWQNSNISTGVGFYLSAPYAFPAMTGHQSGSPASSPPSRIPPSSTLPPTHYSNSSYVNSRTPQLYSPPSRISLSSLHSYSGQQEPVTLSDKVKSELRDYASSFDHVRDWKRRMTVV